MAGPRKPGNKRRSSATKSGKKALSTSAISLGREICSELAAAEQREWLVTNGIGGFASGTVAGQATRRYHGLLIAALDPPAKRTHLVAGIDEMVRIGDQSLELATHRWVSGAVAPEGYKHIHGFRLDGEIPTWTFQTENARLERRVWMKHGENTTFVRYTLGEFTSSVELVCKVLVNYRDYHSSTHAGFPPNEWRMRIESVTDGVRVTAYDGAIPFYLKSKEATARLEQTWYRDFSFRLEGDRGLDDHEDQLLATIFRAHLKRGESLTLVFSTEANVTLDGAAELKRELTRQAATLAASKSVRKLPGQPAPNSQISQLVLAADQFVTDRSFPGQPVRKTIIAGYHWFGDWGRDTMIALPGLTLAAGRPEVAKQILLAFSRFVDRGMLPNHFPDVGGTPEYNTIDATLWYFEATRQYFAATNDVRTLKELFPVLEQIILAHLNGTRYNIHVDHDDGLLYGGGPGVQLTWMDAKIGDWVVTPRTGKPVEINALWINALETMWNFADVLGEPATSYSQHRQNARSSFAKFWNAQRNCCFDVIDSPGIGRDSTLRPNQIFAVSLTPNLLTSEQQKSIVDICAKDLLTPFGLRSLAQGEPGYTGTYSGGPRERDAAYHQGTVWGWLLGPFALAHYRVYRNRTAALAFLEPSLQSIDRYGLGTLPEIYDGDPPHHPRGCIAQAWTVAELLRAWQFLASASSD